MEALAIMNETKQEAFAGLARLHHRELLVYARALTREDHQSRDIVAVEEASSLFELNHLTRKTIKEAGSIFYDQRMSYSSAITTLSYLPARWLAAMSSSSLTESTEQSFWRRALAPLKPLQYDIRRERIAITVWRSSPP